MKKQTLKTYQKIIWEVKSFNLSELDDSDLSAYADKFKAKLKLGKSPDIIPEAFAVIREVIDKRLGIWKLFDPDFSGSIDKSLPIQKAYDTVNEKRKSVDDSQIHLDASFYKAVRKVRQSVDKLTFLPYDVQLMGALALYDGRIAEMGTGEGKTVVAVFPACLWALGGKKVHIATVNDYLALRDCLWMGPVFKFMGLKVDCILSYMSDAERRTAYNADIVYGNNYEFGFDYLRDNIKNRISDRVQGKLEYAIIDEIDSILMDEATTPLIISGVPEDHASSYWKFKAPVELLLEKQSDLIEQLFSEFETESDQRFIKLIQISKADPWNARLLNYLSDNKDASKKMSEIQGRFATARSEYKLEEDLFYVVEEKNRSVKLTDRGIAWVEQQLGNGFFTLNPESSTLKCEELRNFLQLLRAYILYRRDEDYVVHNGRIVIVDEFTGRLAFGKKYEEGLHQAIECKEGLQITPENRIMGKITHPNYFRLYEKIVGMTATAHTEAYEFKKLYNLEVVRIPTNKPVIRVDLPDRLYRTEDEKLDAIIGDIEECYSLGRPVLAGTRSVEKSERLSNLLTERGIPHNVLNAKNHALEAEIIKSAGQPYAVTIATNMAGRGTDIALGKDLCFGLGLHVIGTERHSARRIDDQLIGRSGRQGDPGSSRFYMSLQDDLFRIFASEEMSSLGAEPSSFFKACMVKALDLDQSHEITRLTQLAQRKSEELSYSIRKHLIERDDIMDKQRKVIYKMRLDILTDDTIKEHVRSLITGYVNDLINCGKYVDTKRPSDEWDLDGLKRHCMADFGVRIPELEGKQDAYLTTDEIKKTLVKAFEETQDVREHELGNDFSRKLEKAIIIDALDTAWADYLSFQNEFDNSLLLRSHVKDNTLADYRLESSKLFKDLLASIRHESLRGIFTYPLPGEKMDSVRWAEYPKPISAQVMELLSA